MSESIAVVYLIYVVALTLIQIIRIRDYSSDVGKAIKQYGKHLAIPLLLSILFVGFGAILDLEFDAYNAFISLTALLLIQVPVLMLVFYTLLVVFSATVHIVVPIIKKISDIVNVVKKRVIIASEPAPTSIPAPVLEKSDDWMVLLWTWADENKVSEDTIPKKIEKLTKMKSLCFKKNNLTELPKEIGQLINLKTLDLSFNNLTELPKEIGQLINLKMLDLSFNNLTGLPKEIGQLINLETLDLSSNNLTELPKKTGQLTKLKRIDLTDQRNAKLSLDISPFTELKYLKTDSSTLFPGDGVIDYVDLDDDIYKEKVFLKYDDIGDGWFGISGKIHGAYFEVGGNTYTNVLGDLASAVNHLLSGGKEARYWFMQEPGKDFCLLTNLGNNSFNLLNVSIDERLEGFDFTVDDPKKFADKDIHFFEEIVSLSEYADAIYRLLNTVLENEEFTCDNDSLQESCLTDFFPLYQYHLLCGYLSKPSSNRVPKFKLPYKESTYCFGPSIFLR